MVKNVQKLLTGLLGLVLLFGCQEPPEVKEASVSPSASLVNQQAKTRLDHLWVREVTIGAIGDLLIHSRVYNDAKTATGYDFLPMVAPVTPYFESLDLMTANQETMIGGVEHGLSTYPAFNSPQQVGDMVKALGADVVTLANNHTLDRGEAVIQSALNYWDQLEIPYVGSYRSEADQNEPRIVEKNDISFAFLGYSYGTNSIPVPSGKDYLINLLDREQMREDVTRAKAEADVVVMHLHFGLEYQTDPNQVQRDWATYAANLGVDIIFGHHPHVLQPPEWIERDDGSRTFVIYSLGNFLSGQDRYRRQVGAMQEITVEKQGESIHLKDPRLLLTYVSMNPSPPRNYRVHPFYALDEATLPNHQALYEEMKAHMSKRMDELSFIEEE